MRPVILGAIAVIALGLVPVSSPPSPARAADATVTATSVENGYPKQLLFKLSATAPTNITDVTLQFAIVGQGSSAIGKPEPDKFTAGIQVTTEVKVNTDPDSEWIPVGNEIRWSWEITQADGTVTRTEERRFLYLPPDREWKNLAGGPVLVYYSGSRDSLAQRFATELQKTYENHGKTLLKTDLVRKPVKVVLFLDNNDLKKATPSKGTTLDNSRLVVTCGVRPGNVDDVIFGTISCGDSDPVDTIRHEFGHILNAAAGEGTLVRLPTWMDEGLAVIAQASPGDYTVAFEAAVRGNRLIPFRQMATPVADQNQVILQYGQSHAMVKYLIDKFGPEKLQSLLAATRKNTRFDEALKATYGFDIDGFEAEFKAAQRGGAGGATPTVRPQQQQPTTAPTQRPAQQPQATPTPAPQPRQQPVASNDDDNNDRLVVGLVGGGILLLLCAVMAFLFAMMLQNQRVKRS
jgi:hypothetical protein